MARVVRSVIVVSLFSSGGGLPHTAVYPRACQCLEQAYGRGVMTPPSRPAVILPLTPPADMLDAWQSDSWPRPGTHYRRPYTVQFTKKIWVHFGAQSTFGIVLIRPEAVPPHGPLSLGQQGC